MTNAIALREFKFEGVQLRTVEDESGIWFVAKDIAEALEYPKTSNPARLFAHVPGIWAGVKRIHTRSENGVEQAREMLCLSEQGVYFFLGRSDKKKALPYQMWIAGDVVPSIRKHGMYATPTKIQDILDNPDAFIEALQAYKEEKAKREALEAKAEEDRPKVVFAEAVSASESSILIGSLAKILKQNGIKTGPIKLFEWMRENGYLSNQHGESWNMPTQKSLDLKLFEVRESITTNPDGTTMLHFTTKVTGKGQKYFINLFKKREGLLHGLELNEETL